MYKVKISTDQLRRLKGGDKDLLLQLLQDSDEKIVKELKANKDNVAFLQGASHVIDKLIEVLSA